MEDSSVRLWNVFLIGGDGVFPACRQDSCKFLLRSGVLWVPNAVLGLDITRVVIIELTGNDFTIFPLSPLNVTMTVSAD